MEDVVLEHERLAQLHFGWHGVHADLRRRTARAGGSLGLRHADACQGKEDGPEARELGLHAAILRARRRKKCISAAPSSAPARSSTWSSSSFLNSLRRSSRRPCCARTNAPRTAGSEVSTSARSPDSGSCSS